jgi:hypothetical protein
MIEYLQIDSQVQVDFKGFSTTETGYNKIYVRYLLRSLEGLFNKYSYSVYSDYSWAPGKRFLLRGLILPARLIFIYIGRSKC